jgi:hypothetical protein
MAQNGSDVAVGAVGQRQQPMFDFDIIMCDSVMPAAA